MNDYPFDIFYWDASAVLSTLLNDEHSREARSLVQREALHLGSSLTWAEVHAVLSRVKQEGLLAPMLVDSSLATLDAGPWRWLTISPDFGITREMAKHHVLRGADLWHLTVTKSLLQEFPNLRVVTFDQRLARATVEEGLNSLP